MTTFKETVEAAGYDFNAFCSNNAEALVAISFGADASVLLNDSDVSLPGMTEGVISSQVREASASGPHKLSVAFSGRVSLKKGKFTAPDENDGFYDERWTKELTSLNSMGYKQSGLMVPQDSKLKSIKFWCRNNNSSSNCQWRMHVVKHEKNENSTSVFNTPLYSDTDIRNYSDTDPHYVEIALDDTVSAGDLIVPVFERTTSSGSSTYYLYISGGCLEFDL